MTESKTNLASRTRLIGLVICLLVVLSVQVVHAAPPIITSWSSTGGTTQNKDDAQDIMYLVQQGDSLGFSATSSESADFEWQVNKAVSATSTEITTDTFNWQVPEEKGIWEIHLKVSNTDGTVHREWVVSTLIAYEAPLFYDSFSDGEFRNRTDTDPWGRPLSEWQAEGGTYPSDPSHFDATTGGLFLTEKNSHYHGLWASFPIPVDEYYKLSFDLITYTPETTQDYFGIDLSNEDGDRYGWKVKNDWHNWYTMLFADGYVVGLAGISQAPMEPYATGIEGPLPNTLYHYRIERQPDHKIYIIRNGGPVWGAWGDQNHNPVGLEFEQERAGNIELWDNPRLYHHSPLDGGGTPDNPYGAGEYFPDITIEGNFTKIGLYWRPDPSSAQCFTIDNIIFFNFNEITGIISGTVTDRDNADPIAEAAMTAGGYSDTTDSAGVYTIAIPVGTYTVSVSADGYQSQSTEDVEVRENQTTTVDFQLTGSSNTEPRSKGCGCRFSGQGNSPFGLVLLLLVLAAIRLPGRRRGRSVPYTQSTRPPGL